MHVAAESGGHCPLHHGHSPSPNRKHVHEALLQEGAIYHRGSPLPRLCPIELYMLRYALLLPIAVHPHHQLLNCGIVITIQHGNRPSAQLIYAN